MSGVVPSLAGQVRERLRYTPARELPRTLFRTLWHPASRWVWCRDELRVYSCTAAHVATLPDCRRFARDRWSDLELYERTSYHGQLPRPQFLEMVAERRARGQHVYTLVEDGRLIHYLWLTDRQQEAHDAKVGMVFYPPPGSAVLWDSYTHPSARGRGLYHQSLSQGLHDAVALAGAEFIYGYVFTTAAASRHVVEKLFDRYDGSLVRQVRFGRVRRFAEPTALPFRCALSAPAPRG